MIDVGKYVKIFFKNGSCCEGVVAVWNENHHAVLGDENNNM